MNTKYRTTVIAGNWKMNMLASEIKPFIDELKSAMPKVKTCETVLCVPAVIVPAMLKAGKEAKVACGAQDVSKFEKGVKLLLPVDTAIGNEFTADCEYTVVDIKEMPEGWMGMDIGPKTVEMFSEAIKNAATVVWNGPMGVFEFDAFAVGTKAMAKALAESNATTIVGGGDSAAAVEKLGFADKMTHISTGGGASLEFLEGLELPGVACLLDK